MRLPKPGPVDIAALTTELVQLVPAVGGITDGPTTLEIRHAASGTFTPAEIARLQQGLTAHDKAAVDQAQMARQARRQALLARGYAKLTIPEQLEVLGLAHGFY